MVPPYVLFAYLAFRLRIAKALMVMAGNVGHSLKIDPILRTSDVQYTYVGVKNRGRGG